jgi:very-short-patch-repair endonuclease
MLWERLRDRRLNGVKFRRQHPIGAYVVDFYCAEARLVIEVDGGVHEDVERKRLDREREEAIWLERGLRFLRLPAAFVENDAEAAIARIASAIAERSAPLLPDRGEGAGG